uniref:Uncharacterized protein n=1 Tax=Arundo donax TaxID=35708 RepID=A0A0A9TQB8_ARUDO
MAHDAMALVVATGKHQSAPMGFDLEEDDEEVAKKMKMEHDPNSKISVTAGYQPHREP